MEEILNSGYLDTVTNTLIKQEAKVETPILNLFYNRKVYVDNGVVSVPVEAKTEDDILPLIDPAVGIKATSVNIQGKYNYYGLKTFGDLKILTAQEIEGYKRQLQNLDPTTYKAKKIEIVNSIMNRSIQRVNSTREYMAGSAILGKIKDKDGNTIYTFDIPADNKLGDYKVSDDTDKPYEVIYAMQKQIKKATKYRGNVGVIIGASAYEKLLQSPSYQRYYERSLMNVEATINGIDGYINGKVPFIVADEEYTDKEGNKKYFFNEDSILMAPTKVFAEFYQGIITNKGKFAKLFHIDSWENNNPDGQAIRLQSASMPITTLPNGIVTATLS